MVGASILIDVILSSILGAVTRLLHAGKHMPPLVSCLPLPLGSSVLGGLVYFNSLFVYVELDSHVSVLALIHVCLSHDSLPFCHSALFSLLGHGCRIKFKTLVVLTLNRVV